MPVNPPDSKFARALILVTDASAVSFDSVLPTVTSIAIASDNNYDNDNSTSYAKAGDTVTLTFYTSEIVQTPSSTIAA